MERIYSVSLDEALLKVLTGYLGSNDAESLLMYGDNMREAICGLEQTMIEGINYMRMRREVEDGLEAQGGKWDDSDVDRIMDERRDEWQL